MKNWKTSLLGAILGVVSLLGQGPINLKNVIQAAATVALGLAAKDNNVTGGDVKQ